MARATTVGSVSVRVSSGSPAIAARARPIHNSTPRVSTAWPSRLAVSAASATSARPPKESGCSRRCGQVRSSSGTEPNGPSRSGSRESARNACPTSSAVTPRSTVTAPRCCRCSSSASRRSTGCDGLVATPSMMSWRLATPKAICGRSTWSCDARAATPAAAGWSDGCPLGYMLNLCSAIESSTRNSLYSRESVSRSMTVVVVSTPASTEYIGRSGSHAARCGLAERGRRRRKLNRCARRGAILHTHLHTDRDRDSRRR